MIRLVKGAYWDSEIKWAQVDGMDGYPLYTRKVHTDISYLACARKLLDAQDAVFPQFATHNAYTLAAIYQMGKGKNFEHQCLHGMGETLYDQVVGPQNLGRRVRVYAPVGTHETLLAIWCAACWKTARTPPSSTKSSTKTSASTSLSKARLKPSRKKASTCTPRCRCRATFTAKAV